MLVAAREGLYDLSQFTSVKVSEYTCKIRLGADAYELATQNYVSAEAVAAAIRAHADGTTYTEDDLLNAIALTLIAPDAESAYLPRLWARVARQAVSEELGEVVQWRPINRTGASFALRRDAYTLGLVATFGRATVVLLSPCCTAPVMQDTIPEAGVEAGSCSKCWQPVIEGKLALPVLSDFAEPSGFAPLWEALALDPLLTVVEEAAFADLAPALTEAAHQVSQLKLKRSF